MSRFGSLQCAVLLMLIAGITCPVIAQPIGIVSVPDPSVGPPASGGGDSIAPVISSDSHHVLFTSTANNLAVVTNSIPFRSACLPRLNVFLRDSNTTTMVSSSLSGTAGGNGDSIGTDLAECGLYALFESSASDLVPGDTNNCSDVFWRDIAASTTRLVSVGSDGAAANGESRESTMTPDGRYAAFVSDASNLVLGDTNRIADVFVMDMQSNRMTLVSDGAMSSSRAFGGGGSRSPDITADGRYVVFYSSATNLVPGVGSAGDIYVRDLAAGITHWASAGARAELAAASWMGNPTNAVMSHPMISGDGHYVVFCVSPASGSIMSAGLILRYNMETGLTEVVHTNAFVVAATASDEMRCLDMTPDGETIAYLANTSTSVTNFGSTSCIRVWDGRTGTTLLASANMTNQEPLDSTVGWPSIDPTGRFVAFMSPMTNQPYDPVFVTNLLNPGYHLYVRDLQAGSTKLIDADTNGTGCGVSSYALSRLVAGGQHLAFQAPDGNLVPGDSNHGEDVFLWDLATGTIRLVSARDPNLPSLTPNGATAGWPMSISGDGRYVAFTSEADNLVASDTNKCQDVFVRDLVAGANCVVSACTNSSVLGNGSSFEPSISGDGRYVAFTSYATNLVAGDSNKARDVFIRDLLAGATTLVSVNSNRTGPGNWDSYTPLISADGHHVLFHSKADNIASVSSGGVIENLFYRDLQSGVTLALTAYGVHSAAMTPDGRFVAFIGAISRSATNLYLWATNLYLWDSQSAKRTYTNTVTGLSQVTISPDGSLVAYATASQLYAAAWKTNTIWTVGAMAPSSHAGMRFSADGRFLTFASTNTQMLLDTNGTYDVYLYDLQTRSNLLVSKSYASPGAGNEASDCPDISPDGRYVAFRSAASNIAPGDINGIADAFLYDRLTDTTMMLSVSRFNGGPADSWSFPPLFNSDGRQVFFQSWASDLAGFDFNHGSDVFAYAVFYTEIVPGGLPAQGPTLSWPALTGKTYRVQFIDNVGVGDWQEAGGSVTTVGGRVYFTDPAPATAWRFYRVVAN